MPIFLTVAAVSWMLTAAVLFVAYIMMYQTVRRIVQGAKMSTLKPANLGPIPIRSVLITGGMCLLFHFSWMVAGIFWIFGIPHEVGENGTCDPELYAFGRNLVIAWGGIFLAHSLYTYLTRELH